MSVKIGHFEEPKPEIDVTAYVYSYKFLWIGWVVVRNPEPPTYYYDNNPVAIAESPITVRYITLGFTQKSVFNKVRRWIVNNIEDCVPSDTYVMSDTLKM